MKTKVVSSYGSSHLIEALFRAIAIATFAFVMSAAGHAQARLPFVGTRTFCSRNDVGMVAIVTISNGGKATVQTNMVPGDSDHSVTFSGTLNAKRILKGTGKYYLKIESGARFVLYDGQFPVDFGVPCNEVVPNVAGESEEVHRILTSLPRGSVRAPDKEMTADSLIATLYRQGNYVFQTRDRALLDRYFEPPAADIIWNELIKDEAEAEPDDVDGSFEGVLFYPASDLQLGNFIIAKPNNHGQIASVKVTYENFGAKNSIVFILSRATEKWQIRDVEFVDAPGETLLKRSPASALTESGRSAPLGAGSGEPSVSPTAPARVRGAPQPAQRPRRASSRATETGSSQTYLEAAFERVEDLEGLAQKYPFLKGALDEVIEINKDPEQSYEHTMVYVADAHQTGRVRMLLVIFQSMVDCGNRGCELSVYVDEGNGFIAAEFRDGSLLVYEINRFYVADEELSLLVCLRDGRSEWKFRDNAFEHIGKYQGHQKLKPCLQFGPER